jgi:hypothetical protein
MKGKTFWCAEGLVPGTKDKPFPVDRGAVQVDGVALEFNTDPAASEDEWFFNIRRVMTQLEEMVPGFSLATVPTARFGPKAFAELSEKAKELGCEPDFNAYNDGRENPKPNNLLPMRTAGGHIHLGWTSDEDVRDPLHIQRCITLIKHMDVYLGLTSLLWDNDAKRRSMYGKAGAFRPKPYGVEYRSLSNAWLKSDDMIRYIYRQSIACLNALMNGERFDEGDYHMAERYINESRTEYAKALLGVKFKHLELPPGCGDDVMTEEKKRRA